MAKARAIVKRRKAVRNIRKITKTMQMIATAKFQKALKRAVGTKPFTTKVRELVAELASSVGGNVEHPLLRSVEGAGRTNRIAVLVITANRGLAGAYNGNVLRTANAFIKRQESEGKGVDLYAVGKKGITFFNYLKRPIKSRIAINMDNPTFPEVQRAANDFIDQFTARQVDAVYVVYMSFISTGVQKAAVLTLLPLQAATGKPTPEQAQAGATAGRPGATVIADTIYEFSPGAGELLDDLLPLSVRTALYQCFLDAVSSENVSRMVSMKSATDNADKMIKSLTMRYNRARQSQITTELSEIMGGVEAMKK